MKRYNIKNKKGKVIAEVFYYLESFNKYETKEEYIKNIVKETQFIKNIEYGGYKKKKYLEKSLFWFNFDSNKNIKKPSIKINEKGLIKTIKEVLNNCKYVINSKKIYIFIFPSFSNFVIKKMDGVNGDVPWYNTISISIFPTKKWKKAVKETITHELAHALSPYYPKDNSLGSMFVFDGIAEHFREYFVGGKRALWTKAFAKKKAIKLFKKLKSKLNSKNDKLYREIFYGTGKYPLWAGYTIGYYIVEDYLKNQEEIDWKKIIKTKPQVILNNLKFISSSLSTYKK